MQCRPCGALTYADSTASMAGKRIAVLKGSYPETWAREHVPTAISLPVESGYAQLDDMLPTGRADVVVGFYTRQGCLAETQRRPWVQECASPTDARNVRRTKGLEGATRADGVLKEMWADGSH